MGKPVRLSWAIRDCFYPEYPENRDFHLIVLCSASKRVRGAEMSEGGYIQGAGDDSEGWSYGLTPKVFWKNKKLLLSTPEEQLPDLVRDLLEKERQNSPSEQATLIKPTTKVFIAKDSILHDSTLPYDLIIDCHADPVLSEGNRLNLGCVPGKLGSRRLRKVLENVENFVSGHLNSKSSPSIMVACETGKDLSVGTALMILCLFFNDTGEHSTIRVSTKYSDEQVRVIYATSTQRIVEQTVYSTTTSMDSVVEA